MVVVVVRRIKRERCMTVKHIAHFNSGTTAILTDGQVYLTKKKEEKSHLSNLSRKIWYRDLKRQIF